MEKTIAAISTGTQPAGISIVRMSGPEAMDIADRVFHTVKMKPEETGTRPLFHKMKSHTIHYGFISDGEYDIDEVLVMVMKAPRTFTGEDTIEINCHGGILVARRILELLLRRGASPAEPGEFTKRAFLNGRMDLSKAEAVINVIDAQNDFALKASVSQLKGSVSVKVKELRGELLDEISFIEASLDDPEHYELDNYGETLKEKLMPIREEIREMIRRADYGTVLTEGVKTVIAGRPNAGKSSLLNLMAGSEKAIVTEIAGTTRDVLEVPVIMHNISLILMDTAGIRETEDRVEKIGVDRAMSALDRADLVLYMIDASSGVTEEDRGFIAEISRKENNRNNSCRNDDSQNDNCLNKNSRMIILLNKTDLMPVSDEMLQSITEDIQTVAPECPVIPFSSLTERGLSDLESTIEALYNAEVLSYNDQTVITNARQKELLHEALAALNLVLESIEMNISEDFIAMDLMSAYSALGRIVGEEVGEDVINRIFEKFCMGK